MGNYLKQLLIYFVDGTELDSVEYQALSDNGLIEQVNVPGYIGYQLTDHGREVVKTFT